MSTEDRSQRLAEDLAALTQLRQDSSIFDFQSFGDPPQRYEVVFRGKGLSRSQSAGDDVEFLERHEVEVRLPSTYPERAPDIRWLTPLFHPNVSFSGFITLEDIGLHWEPALTLDVVCERLWDVVRLATFDLERSTNYAARTFFEKRNAMRLPVDARPLRNERTPAASNIIHYERRDGRRVRLPETAGSEVLFIGEETMPPAGDPADRENLPPQRPVRPPAGGNEDVFFIGDD